MNSHTLGRFLKKLVVTLTAAGLLMSFLPDLPVSAAEKQIVICIDPGHGGESMGVEKDYDGVHVAEKDLNFKIAAYLAMELSNYENVKVIATRMDDRDLTLKQRVNFAAFNHADYLISVHNNQASDVGNLKINGCMVLTPVSRYQVQGARSKDVYGDSLRLGQSIVKSLRELGLGISTDLGASLNGGIVQRPYNTLNGTKKDLFDPDGSPTDYYGLIRYGVYAGIPTIIVEHAYVSNLEEYRKYLKTDEQLQKLAAADARGIAEALGLKKKS